MFHRIANMQSAMAAVQTTLFRSCGHSGRSHRARAFTPFLIFPFAFFLCFAATPARAVNAVITFTNFPSVVSNTYNGVITLQINGLTNGVTNVVVQKFLDVNTNGVIDSGDLLVQQFPLIVGQASVFTNEETGAPVIVTNFMPGDMTSVTGQITAPLNFQNGDFAQNLVGKYLYKISSPSGLFAPVTNVFTVTNTFFSSLVTGAVVNATTSVPVPNAIVLLCVVENNGGLVMQSGTVANNAGLFSLRAPPAPTGVYSVAGVKSNFVSFLYSLPLSAKETNFLGTNGDLPLNSAAFNVTGRFINAANSNGLAGVSGMLISTNSSLSIFFTDTNGNFSAPVTASNVWNVEVDPFAAAFQGSLTWQTNLSLNISNKTLSFTNALPPATSIFYGVVSNSAAAPMPGVYVYAGDTTGHQSLGMTDQHGNYMAGALAWTNLWQLSILWPDNPGLTNNYVFSPGYVETNNLQFDQAFQQNFSLLIAFYTISGTVSDADGNPVAGAVVFATNATYQAFSAVTASDGSYSLDVSSGPWTVGITPASLQGLGYENVPANQTTSVSDADPNVTVNFSVVACTEIEILTTNLADAIVGDYYKTNLPAESCQNVTNWFPAYGVTLTSLYDQTNTTYPAGTPIYSDSGILGYVLTIFYFGANAGVAYSTNCSCPFTENNDEFVWGPISATITVSGPITGTNQVVFPGDKYNAVWTMLPTTQSAPPYSTSVKLSRYPPVSSEGNDFIYYTGEFPNPNGALLRISGTSNRVASVAGAFHSVPTVGNSGIVASSIPYTNLDNSVVWISYGTKTGEYFISAYGPQSTNLPPGFSLYQDGRLAGTPTATSTNGIFNFSVAAEDTASNITVQPLTMFVYPGTTITGPSSSQAGMLQSSNIFQMHVTGVVPGFGYTVLMTTNLSPPNWVPIYTTNAVNTNSFIVPDTTATNTARFYRLEISPPGS